MELQFKGICEVQSSSSRDSARVCVALALVLFSSYILNTFLFPPIAGVFPVAREITTYGGVVFSVVVAMVAWHRPSAMNETIWTTVVFVASVVSASMLSWGTVSANETAILAGSPLGGIAGIWLSVLVGAALSSLAARQVLLVVPGAFLVDYAVRMGVMAAGVFLDVPCALIAFMASLVASYVLVRPLARKTLCAIHDSVAPTVLNVTSPSSYLPLSSFVYVAVFLFSVACGFAVSGETQRMEPTFTLASFLPVSIAFVVGAVRGAASFDSVYKAAALLAFAGFLTAPLVFFENAMLGRQMNAAFLNSGSDLFSMLLYCLVAVAGARNRLGAVSVATTAFAAQWVGIGVGAPIAQAAARMGETTPAAAAWVTMVIAFVFIAFNYIGAERFSFSRAIGGIVPAHVDCLEAQAPAERGADYKLKREVHADDTATGNRANAAVDGFVPGCCGCDAGRQNAANEDFLPATKGEDFESACSSVAERFGLTAREAEVFELLARGRTSLIIQEKLVLSHNTVKTHVRHIYAKLDVHSQQELISIVEREYEVVK